MSPLLALLLIASADAATLDVGPGQPYDTLQQAINASSNGDTIIVHTGTYDTPSQVNGKDLIIEGLGTVLFDTFQVNALEISGADVTLRNVRITPNGGRGLLVSNADVTLEDVVVEQNNRAGNPFDGAALSIRSGATVVVRDSAFRDNVCTANLLPWISQGQGGHVQVINASAQFINTTFDNSTGVNGGAIYARDGATVQLTDVVVTDAESDERGGAVYLGSGSSLSVIQSSLTGTQAGDQGGAVYATTSSLALFGVSLVGSTAPQGGGLYLNQSTLDWTRGALDGGGANQGGGIYAKTGSVLELTDVSMCSNDATTDGGAIYGDMTNISLTNVSIADGSAGRGAGVWTTGPGSLFTLHGTFAGLSAGEGSALWVNSGLLSMNNSLVSSNGGGVAVQVSGSSSTASIGHTLWFDNAGGDTLGTTTGDAALFDDPLLYRLDADGLCNDDLRLRAGSVAIDAGDPASGQDPDGSAPDLGATGGPSSSDELWLDLDIDGWLGAYDCRDDNATVNPGQIERCDGFDTDCDGVVDGPDAFDATTAYLDADGDSFGDPLTEARVCDLKGWVTMGGDCDDVNPDIRPGAAELCNGIDDNCDDLTDGPDALGQTTWFADADADLFGDSTITTTACEQPKGFSQIPGDCDDEDATIFPGAAELCDGLDRDCDGTPDAPDPADGPLWATDADGDGWGTGDAVRACLGPPGTGILGDCDDSADAVYPGAEEDCTADTDMNCDGWFGTDDQDGDGFPACEDCDDGNAEAYPGAPDTPYDGVLLDCNRANDWDADADLETSSTYGGTDCNDDDPQINTAAEDLPGNGVDEDCDGADAPPEERTGCQCSSTGVPPVTPLACLFLVAMVRRSVPRTRRVGYTAATH